MRKEEIMRYSPVLKFGFFLLGLIATFAYRIIIVLNFYSPYWVKVSWYVGTVGFTLYFAYRFDIQRRESNLVRDHDLLSAIEKSAFRGKKKKALMYVIRNDLKSKAKWNSLFIAILSLIALVVGILLDTGLIVF